MLCCAKSKIERCQWEFQILELFFRSSPAWYVRGLSNLVLELVYAMLLKIIIAVLGVWIPRGNYSYLQCTCTWYLVRNKRTRYVPGTYVAQSWRAHFIGTLDGWMDGWIVFFERMDGRAKLYLFIYRPIIVLQIIFSVSLKPLARGLPKEGEFTFFIFFGHKQMKIKNVNHNLIQYYMRWKKWTPPHLFVQSGRSYKYKITNTVPVTNIRDWHGQTQSRFVVRCRPHNIT